MLPARETLSMIKTQAWLAAALLFALITAVHYDVIFRGRSLVLTDHFNTLDMRPLSQNYGDNFVPPEEWTSRNLWPYPNIRDPEATWWQWESALKFLKRSI